MKDPVNGAQLAGSWAVRETFVAVVTTNLPMIFPLVKHMLSPLLDTIAQSMRSSSDKRSTDRKRSIVTFGGGGGSSGQNWRGRGPRTANPIPQFTFSESEERILVENGQVKMQVITTIGHTKTSSPAGSEKGSNDTGNTIRKDVEFAMTVQDGGEQGLPPPSKR